MLEYDFDIVYCLGNKNVIPDFLSRIYLVELTSPDEDRKDQEIAKSKNKIFVPFADISQLLKQAHRTYTRHLRTAKLFSFISSRYFWSSLFRDGENIVKSCLISARIHSTIDYRNMKLMIAVYPLQIISLDTGCITYGNDNKFYFVVAINHFTWLIEVRVLQKENSKEIIQFLKDFIIYRHGCPAKIQTDGRTICV